MNSNSVFFDVWACTPPAGQIVPQWILDRARRIRQEGNAPTPGSGNRLSTITAQDVQAILNKESTVFRSRRGVPLRRAVAIFGAPSVEYAMKRGRYPGETYCGCDIGEGRTVYFLTTCGVRLAASFSNEHVFYSRSAMQ